MCELVMCACESLCKDLPRKPNGSGYHHLFASPTWKNTIVLAEQRLQAVKRCKDHHSDIAVALVCSDVVHPIANQASLLTNLPKYKVIQLQDAVNCINDELLFRFNVPRRLPSRHR